VLFARQVMMMVAFHVELYISSNIAVIIIVQLVIVVHQFAYSFL
jgi:hypothetical protein